MRQLELDLRPHRRSLTPVPGKSGVILRNDPECTLCRLHSTAKTVCLLGVGAKPSDVMIIGEAPGRQEDLTGEPFVGKSGELLHEVMGEYGFRRDQVFITNAVSCRPPDNRTPSKGEIKACKAWLDYQIKKVQPKYVLLLGNTPLMSITGKAGITKRRGRPFEQDGIIFLPTFHPAFLFRDEDGTNTAMFERDIKLFREVVDKGAIPREDKLRHTVVRTRKDFEAMLDALRGAASFDIETNCLYPWQVYETKKNGQKVYDPAEITVIGFGTATGEFTLPINHKESPWSKEALADMIIEIEERLKNCYLIAHNGKFDYLWMWVHFGVTWYEFAAFDTMLAHYAIDENTRHGLKELAMKFCGAPDWDLDNLEKRARDTPLIKLGVYHGHDLYYTRELYFIFKRMLADEPDAQKVFRKILMPAARQFTEVEYDGVYIEMDKFDLAEKVFRDQFNLAKKNLEQWIPDIPLKMLDKHGNEKVIFTPGQKNRKGQPIPFNWGSTQQLAALLFGDEEDGGLEIDPLDKTTAGNPSCSESVLKRIDHPMVGDLLKFREAKQQLSFFIDGWKPFLHRKFVNGTWCYFLHPVFKIHGTVTGRLSCEHPNLQQVPRDPRIRSLISAEPGWTLIECDLSQIELRIAAEIAGERHMLEAFRLGIDVHWLTAIREIERGAGYKELVLDTARTWKQDKALSYSESIEVLLGMGPDAATEIHVEWKELRKKAKAINFGYLYGMWWKKFKLYARDNYDVIVTDEQAEASRTAFFDLYSDYPKWHKRQKRFANKHGYVRSLSGRRRRLPAATSREDTPERGAAERQAINSPVQSFANDINLMALIQLRKEFGRDVVRACGTVHDAILARVRNDMVPQVMTRLLEIMQRPELFDDFEIDLEVPVLAEGKVGPWGAGISLEKWMKENGRSSKARAYA